MPVVKKILVTCGTAIAISTLIARTIEEGMAARGIPVLTRLCKTYEVNELAALGYDLIVSTSIIKGPTPIPMVRGAAFLGSAGHEQVMDEIALILQKV